LEIATALRAHPEIKVRMGIHSGPVKETADVNDPSNIAGAGINIAQRVMNCGVSASRGLSKNSQAVISSTYYADFHGEFNHSIR
jgi:hypothetical protein